jgi:hypothetical protein
VARVSEPPGDEPRVAQLAHAHRNINVVLDQVGVAIVEADLEADAREGLGEGGQGRNDLPRAHPQGQLDAQQASRRAVGAPDRPLGVLELRQQSPTVGVKSEPASVKWSRRVVRTNSFAPSRRPAERRPC